ncbi:AAA family ATPase [Corynebacterium liangguodongii]|uniref:ATPase n=1 Tax=Corynebacterium liangguodongii TaxID=2079535 RepID=A0A2S0WGJ4_9CORY|nr:AAA family ATPase [Corynebacterium liangguodongii]AWB84897.1 ATPase [Corynebacterium liangguodongii]PWB99395.1 ATPase [Corynebacterium liangguodongii]
MYIRALRAQENPRAEPWVFDVAAVSHLLERGEIDLSHPATIFTGDNGVGKSTLIEAIARGYGFSTAGGTWGVSRAGAPDALYEAAFVAETPRAKQGYFLRADAHFAQATSLGAHELLAGNLHHRSHGESVLAIVDTFVSDGLYILDEPESGLSAVSQMALMAILHRLARDGAQIIMATHSPILLGLPEAHIIEITREAMTCGMGLEETTAFRAMRDFLDDPVAVAEFMIDVTRP